jgi:hypothetical protein
MDTALKKLKASVFIALTQQLKDTLKLLIQRTPTGMNKVFIGEVNKDEARKLVRSWGFKKLPIDGRENLVSRPIASWLNSESIGNVNGKYYRYEYQRFNPMSNIK